MKTRDVFRRHWFGSTHYIRLGKMRSLYIRIFDREYRFQIVAEFKPTFASRTVGKDKGAATA